MTDSSSNDKERDAQDTGTSEEATRDAAAVEGQLGRWANDEPDEPGDERESIRHI